MGESGEGFSRTRKDTWTKPRGRVGAREGGEFHWDWGEWLRVNADNCN